MSYTDSSSHLELPQWINIIDLKKTETHDTSSFIPQLGGEYSATSASSAKDINQLISMLTESSDSTVTEQLESKLRAKLTEEQNGGGMIDNLITRIKTFFMGAEEKKGEELLNNINKLISQLETSETPSDSPINVVNQQDGGKKHKEQDGGREAPKHAKAMVALNKHIASALNVKYTQVLKLGGQVYRDTKEKYPSLDTVKLYEKGIDVFNENKEKYRKMLA